MARIKPKQLLQQSKNKKGPSRISITTIIFFALIVILILFFLHSTYTHWTSRSQLQTESRQSVFEGGRTSDLPGYAVLNTAKGFITVELFKDSSPGVVDDFIDRCQKGHFKGMPFRRVIKHFVIQAGSTDETAAVTEDWTVKGKHFGHFDTSMKHEAFMLGTSKTKQDSGGFELFITTAPIPDLNDKLIVFGRVVKGEDVVQTSQLSLSLACKEIPMVWPDLLEIEEVDTDEHYRPKSSIGIIDVTLKEKI
ncbi:hypothetical protein ACFE04_019216 [Oxalis oulophora]